MSANESLTSHVILEALCTRWLGRSLHVYQSVGSTNTILSELAASGAPAGTLVITDYQTHGRGRGQRRWQAPRGTSLLLSMLLRPQWPTAQAPWLTMIAGLAALAAIEFHTNLKTGLKWPNDVMIWDATRDEPQWCKAGGILLETRIADEWLQEAILGMGLNVNIARDDLPPAATPTTSLLAAGNQTVPRIPLLESLLLRLESLYDQTAAGASPHAAWNARLITRRQPVRVTTSDQVVEGQALGSDEWGRLLVRAPDGQIHRFAAGDVTLR